MLLKGVEYVSEELAKETLSKSVNEDNNLINYKFVNQEAIESDDSKNNGAQSMTNDFGTDLNFKRKIVWKNVIGFIFLHLCAFYGYILCFTQAKSWTIIYMFLVTFITSQGVTAGAHRLWSHKSYKIRTPLKIILLIFQTISGQNCLWVWVRDHRQHHRYSDTDADPHNATRGFFFSHIGWLMSKKHPLVKEMGKTIDMSDLESDPWIMFQKRYYKTLYMIFALLIPMYIPVYFWNEDIWVSVFTCYFGRYIYQLHGTWSVNSLAHYSGYKPYDRSIIPVDSKLVSLMSVGEGWHNFHHTFPWDYRTGEWGGIYNVTTLFLHLMQKIGQVYDLKKATNYMILSRMKKFGDGTKYSGIHDKQY